MYSDSPSPNITNPAPLVQWDLPLRLDNLAVSPDHQSLAVLAHQVLYDEGNSTTVLTTIELNNNIAQSIPDYTQEDAYENFFYGHPARLLGWVDNAEFAIQKEGNGAVLATKSGSYYAALALPQGGNGIEVALSSDRKTIFSTVVHDKYEWWLNDLQGGSPQQVANDSSTELYRPTWSPNDKWISFLTPGVYTDTDGLKHIDFKLMEVWTLDLQTAQQRKLSGAAVWNVEPAWAPDSANLAFLGADDAKNTNPFYDLPEVTDTNIFIAPVSKVAPPVRLTNFQGVKNSGLQWITAGTLVLSSSGGNTDEARGLVAVRVSDGSVVTLVAGSATAAITSPYLFK
ncbi:MAG: hypothetical protein M3Z04_14810 [Chloroflexota bacterium]|nr:hypothetical protein [Chloroflexota bacterium]